jgi:4-oxalomesaconate tautomerase
MRNHIGIPCLFMRGGTSKGPYFRAEDLPNDIVKRDKILLAVMGSPDIRQIDGLGGADTLTSKVAIIAKSSRPGIDVDYYFCQVDIGKPFVDTSPPCGNMLSGVAPFAIETGLVEIQEGKTSVVIYDVNISSRIEAVVETPGKQVNYIGKAHIDGVPGTGAPILLYYMDIVGSKTRPILPTSHTIDVIGGIEVSCFDVAMPMMLLRAEDIGLNGNENAAEIEGNLDVLYRIEKLRLEAGRRMDFGDVTDLVIPKVGILSRARHGGTITSRYLTPHKLHSAHAVTGAICVATACMTEGSIAHGLATPPIGSPYEIVIEHTSGHLDLRLETSGLGPTLQVIRAGVMRTARPIMQGMVFVPETLGG